MTDVDAWREVITLIFQSFLVILVVLLVVMAFSIEPQLLIDNFALIFGILLGFIGGAGVSMGLKRPNNNKSA